MAIDTPEYQYMDLYEALGDEPALLTAMVEHLNGRLDGWTATPGNTELVLLEAMVTGLALDVMALRMVDSAVVESLMTLYGVERDPGAQAVATVRVRVMQRTGTVTIDEGTIFQLVRADTEETVEFETTETASIIAATSREAVIAVRVTETGESPNDIQAGTDLDTDGEIDGLESAVLETKVTGGRDEENDDSFNARASAILSRQTSTLATPEHFQYAALEVPGVGRARVLDMFDPARYNPATPDTIFPGHVSVAVADAYGEPLTETVKAAVQEYLEERALASIQVHVIDPNYNTVNFTLHVKAAEGFELSVVDESAADAIRAWLSPATWPWTKTASPFQAAAEATTSALVTSVLNVTGGGALTGPAPLTRAGTITVTSEK